MLDNSLIIATENAKIRSVWAKKAKQRSRTKATLRIIRNAVLIIASVIIVGTVGNSELEPVLAKESKAKEQTYAKTCIITELDYANDVVVCEDVNGFVWQFDGIMDYDLGDMVGLVMNDKGTELIYDDEIISARYNGWLGLWSERGFE